MALAAGVRLPALRHFFRNHLIRAIKSCRLARALAPEVGCQGAFPILKHYLNHAITHRFPGAALLGLAVVLGCSCGGGSIYTPPPTISVSLPVSTVVVPQDGTRVIVPINITSTSETALVMVIGLPGGVGEKYSASDTNPSGSLEFTANASATLGTYMPQVTVNSAGQTASTNFTLIVTAAAALVHDHRRDLYPKVDMARDSFTVSE